MWWSCVMLSFSRTNGDDVMTRWLECRVSKGMFSDERTITVRHRDNSPREFLVPMDMVRGEGEQGQVQVKLVSRRDGKWAVLPTIPYKASIPVEDSGGDASVLVPE